MAGGLILGYVLAGASFLMIAFAGVASGAGVPDGHVISARVAIVVIVEPLVGVGWCVAPAPRPGVGRGWWDAGNGRWRSGGRWRIVVVASSPSAIVSSASSSTSASTTIVALRGGCWWWCRRSSICCGWGHCCWGSGEHCQLLLHGCQVCA